ncbi:F-box only protein 21-like isoform X2 [Cataglyphis hispanica]|nr:F-box only protein 21-like isoform X2 [Cataglyphis hispanica]
MNIENIYEIIITNSLRINSDEKNKKSLKNRTSVVKFGVGMIVRHSWTDHFSNSHDGVIIGWHNKCDETFINKKNKILWHSHQCLKYNHVCRCQKYLSSAYQQHYILLTENNEICYVGQDQLSICPPKKINHMEIGRYFSNFERTHYIPNENLREEYPEDTAAIIKLLANNGFY